MKLQIEHLTFSYEGGLEIVFDDVSFQLDTDWKLGLIGRNGRGKTTLLKLLKGDLKPTSGTIHAPISFAYYPFEISMPEELCIDIALRTAKTDQDWKIRRELNLLDMDADDILYRPFDTLSNGERAKVMLAAMFVREDAYLLIDEPTNHLDAEARRVVGAYLSSKKGYILVSHDRAFLDSATDHVLAINKNDIDVQQGNFSSWWQNKAYRDQFELSEHEKIKKEVSRLSVTAGRTSGWSDKLEGTKYGSGPVDRGYVGHKSAKMMKRAKAVERRQGKLLEQKQELLKNIEEEEVLTLSPLIHHKRILVTAEDYCVDYGGREIFAPMGFQIEQGERIALHGKNGSGKSSILKHITGEPIPHKGKLELASGLVLSYVPQDTSFLRGDIFAFAAEYGLEQPLFLAILRKMGFERIQFEGRLEQYSAGQQKKVLIAKSLCEEAHLYIWDEPLNYIDIYARMQIEQMVLDKQPTLLFVEHDAIFRERVGTKEIKLS